MTYEEDLAATYELGNKAGERGWLFVQLFTGLESQTGGEDIEQGDFVFLAYPEMRFVASFTTLWDARLWLMELDAE